MTSSNDDGFPWDDSFASRARMDARHPDSRRTAATLQAVGSGRPLGTVSIVLGRGVVADGRPRAESGRQRDSEVGVTDGPLCADARRGITVVGPNPLAIAVARGYLLQAVAQLDPRRVEIDCPDEWPGRLGFSTPAPGGERSQGHPWSAVIGLSGGEGRRGTPHVRLDTREAVAGDAHAGSSAGYLVVIGTNGRCRAVDRCGVRPMGTDVDVEPIGLATCLTVTDRIVRSRR